MIEHLFNPPKIELPLNRNWLFSSDALQNLLGWTNEDIQLAINERRIILLEYEDGGQLFCCPGSCWDPNSQK